MIYVQNISDPYTVSALIDWQDETLWYSQAALGGHLLFSIGGGDELAKLPGKGRCHWLSEKNAYNHLESHTRLCRCFSDASLPHITYEHTQIMYASHDNKKHLFTYLFWKYRYI